METERRIKSTGRGADFYGKCERCGKACVVHYKQQWRKLGAKTAGWVNAGYGHSDCLRAGSWADAETQD